MDTINNVTNAATKAIWGTAGSQEEPVSGVKGNTAQGEPYDAGNMDSAEVDTSTPAEMERQIGATASPVGTGIQENPQGIQSENTSTSAGTTGKPGTENPASDEQKATTEVGSSRNPEEDTVSEEELSKKPAPKPLDVLAKERGGDAGNVASHEGKAADLSSSAPGEETNEKSHEDGTGEKYVKSTGFAAEGGDFDASNPGAGREADRLMEEDGHENPGASGHDSGSPDKSKHENGEKKSLKDRIKAKLHKH